MRGEEPRIDRFVSRSAEFAESVARNFEWVAELNRVAGPAVDEAWLAEDLSLFVRYHIGMTAFGVRFDRLDIDPTSESAAGTSREQASNLFHSLHDAPDRPEFTDDASYGWWGDIPAEGWTHALSAPGRLMIFSSWGTPD